MLASGKVGVTVSADTGQFEVTENGVVQASGRVRFAQDDSEVIAPFEKQQFVTGKSYMTVVDDDGSGNGGLDDILSPPNNGNSEIFLCSMHGIGGRFVNFIGNHRKCVI